MIISVRPDALRDILEDAKENRVGISVCRRGGQWSNEYCQIDEIKDVQTGDGVITVVILHPFEGSQVSLLDVQLISAVRFASKLMVMGTHALEIKVESAARIPHHVFEYF